jgi:hypothetical protein
MMIQIDSVQARMEIVVGDSNIRTKLTHRCCQRGENHHSYPRPRELRGRLVLNSNIQLIVFLYAIVFRV